MATGENPIVSMVELVSLIDLVYKHFRIWQLFDILVCTDTKFYQEILYIYIKCKKLNEDRMKIVLTEYTFKLMVLINNIHKTTINALIKRTFAVSIIEWQIFKNDIVKCNLKDVAILCSLLSPDYNKNWSDTVSLYEMYLYCSKNIVDRTPHAKHLSRSLLIEQFNKTANKFSLTEEEKYKSGIIVLIAAFTHDDTTQMAHFKFIKQRYILNKEELERECIKEKKKVDKMNKIIYNSFLKIKELYNNRNHSFIKNIFIPRANEMWFLAINFHDTQFKLIKESIFKLQKMILELNAQQVFARKNIENEYQNSTIIYLKVVNNLHKYLRCEIIEQEQREFMKIKRVMKKAHKEASNASKIKHIVNVRRNRLERVYSTPPPMNRSNLYDLYDEISGYVTD